MSDDVQFVAFGLAPYGFYTDKNADDDGGPVSYGVNVQAEDCGVYGEAGPQTVRDGPERLAKKGTGVYGKGGLYGVCGTGDLTPQDIPSLGVDKANGIHKGVGVLGARRDGVGVIGSSNFTAGNETTRLGSVTTQRVGVEGIGNEGTGVFGYGFKVFSEEDQALPEKVQIDLRATGVLGMHEAGSGVVGYSFGENADPNGNPCGVKGEADVGTGVSGHSKTGPAGVLGMHEAGSGVVGFSLGENADPNSNPCGVKGEADVGTGVSGHSKRGPGGKFDSKTNRGGVFSSQKMAPIRLLPAINLDETKLPAGDVGDLYVSIVADVAAPKSRAKLFFCIGKAATGESLWHRVQLEPTILIGG